MKNAKKKLSSMMGWMLVLTHHGKTIHEDDYQIIMNATKEAFGDDEEGAIEYIKEKFDKYLNELKEEA